MFKFCEKIVPFLLASLPFRQWKVVNKALKEVLKAAVNEVVMVGVLMTVTRLMRDENAAKSRENKGDGSISDVFVHFRLAA